jgi:hypothetical protein
MVLCALCLVVQAIDFFGMQVPHPLSSLQSRHHHQTWKIQSPRHETIHMRTRNVYCSRLFMRMVRSPARCPYLPVPTCLPYSLGLFIPSSLKRRRARPHHSHPSHPSHSQFQTSRRPHTVLAHPD